MFNASCLGLEYDLANSYPLLYTSIYEMFYKPARDLAMFILVHVCEVRIYIPTKNFQVIRLVRLITRRQLILETVRKEREKTEADY